MRVKLNNILFMFTLLIFIMTMTSCKKEVIDYNNGINMDDDVVEEYSEETNKLASDTITGIYDIFSSKFDGTEAKIINKNKSFFVNKMIDVFTVTDIPEEKFQAFLIKLNGEKEDVADVLYAALVSKLSNENKIYVNELYNTIVDTYGSKYVDGIFYGFINCYYDYNIFTNQEYIDTYSKNSVLVRRYQKKLDEFKADQEVFNSIDKESFSSIIRAYIIIKATIDSSNGAVNSLFAFSDKEIEKIVNNFYLECELTTIQWMTLFKLLSIDDNIADIYNAVVKCKDEDVVASILNQLFVVINSIKNDVTADIIKELRTTDEYYKCIYNGLSDKTKDEIKKLVNMKLINKEYQSLIEADSKLKEFFDCSNAKFDDLTVDCDYEVVLKGLLRGMLYE